MSIIFSFGNFWLIYIIQIKTIINSLSYQCIHYCIFYIKFLIIKPNLHLPTRICHIVDAQSRGCPIITGIHLKYFCKWISLIGHLCDSNINNITRTLPVMASFLCSQQFSQLADCKDYWCFRSKEVLKQIFFLQNLFYR